MLDGSQTLLSREELEKKFDQEGKEEFGHVAFLWFCFPATPSVV